MPHLVIRATDVSTNWWNLSSSILNHVACWAIYIERLYLSLIADIYIKLTAVLWYLNMSMYLDPQRIIRVTVTVFTSIFFSECVSVVHQCDIRPFLFHFKYPVFKIVYAYDYYCYSKKQLNRPQVIPQCLLWGVDLVLLIMMITPSTIVICAWSGRSDIIESIVQWLRIYLQESDPE